MATQNPSSLWLLLLLLPLVALMIRAYSRGDASIKRLGGMWRYDALKNVYVVKAFFSSLFFCLFFLFTVLALADIRGGGRLVEDDRRGFDIVIALDVSRSMLARDVSPSRLGKAVDIARDTVSRIADARFAVVVVKGEAFSLLPLTEDVASLDLVFSHASPALMTSPGSDLEKAIRQALAAIQESGRYRFVLLLTDGEYLEGNPTAAAKLASSRGIPLITEAIGTEQGANIQAENGDAVRDRDGRPVVTRLNRNVLARIAQISGGKFYSLAEAPKIRVELMSILKNQSTGQVQKGLKIIRQELYRPFALVALIFLVLHLLARVLRWRNTL